MVSDATPSAGTVRGRALRLVETIARIRRGLPLLSLLLGLASALLMDRSPDRAVRIAIAAAVGWLLWPALLVLGRREAKTRLARAARSGSLAGAQAAAQLSLFFALPFYVKALAGGAGRVAFVAALGLASAATLWDPLAAWLLSRPLPGALLQAVASFAGLNVVLPVLGLSNRASLLAASCAAAVGGPLVALLGTRGRVAVRLAGGVAVGAALPLALLVGAARVVPAAPLELKRAAIGTRLDGLELADAAASLPAPPAQLAGATAIAAPRGLADRLVHVWRKDGAAVDRIPLVVRGGREAGFRTHSVKKHLGARPEGRWRCSVETESGQLLGSAELSIAATSSASP